MLRNRTDSRNKIKQIIKYNKIKENLKHTEARSMTTCRSSVTSSNNTTRYFTTMTTSYCIMQCTTKPASRGYTSLAIVKKKII